MELIQDTKLIIINAKFSGWYGTKFNWSNDL